MPRKFKFHENLTRITGTLHEDQYTFLIISPLVLLRMRNVSYKSCRKIQNTFYFQYIFSENRAVYERLWKNILDPEKPQMTIIDAWALHVGYLRLQTQTFRIAILIAF
jgi:hypothetical protein